MRLFLPPRTLSASRSRLAAILFSLLLDRQVNRTVQSITQLGSLVLVIALTGMPDVR